MHRFLERLDGAASTLVPMLYLAGLMLGTMAYFTGVTIDFGLAVGTALSFAAEMHLFLQMRRVRMAYGQVERVPEDDERRDATIKQFRVNLGILIGLMTFSTYNSIAFVAETFHPAPGFLPAPVQVAIRGGVIPALFLLAGFLTPLAADASVLLRTASHAMLHRTIKRATKQWNKRIDKAWRSGHDLAPIAVALMKDAGDEEGARRIHLIADGLAAVEREPSVRTGLALPSPTASSSYSDRPPTGPGTPSSISSVRTGAEAAAMRDETVASTAVELPVRTDRAVERRASLAAVRAKRLEAVVRWLRAADERGQSLSVRTVRSRLEKMEPRQRVSESTVLQLLRDARKQLDADPQPTREEGQLAQ